LLTPSTIAKLYLQTLSGLAAFARTEGTLQKVLAAPARADLIKLIGDTGVTVDKELMVKDVMRHNVAKVTPDDTLKEVANRMFRHRLSALAVVDDNDRLMGVINDRDLIKAALPDYKALISNLNYSIDVEPFEELLKQEDKIKVAQLYRDDYEVASPETKIVEVSALMIFKDIRRVFVTREDKLVGVLLRKDIVNMVIRG
jgi:CBS domain-containing protein